MPASVISTIALATVTVAASGSRLARRGQRSTRTAFDRAASRSFSSTRGVGPSGLPSRVLTVSAMLLAAQPARTIVIEKGGIAWWVPLVIALLVALVAAAVSYAVTWRFKQADFNRESAIRAVDLVDEAEQLATDRDRYTAVQGSGAASVSRLLQEARVRAQPLGDVELDERFQAALLYIFDLQQARNETGPALHWLAAAITNVREAFVRHLAAPKFIPLRTPRAKQWFPTLTELKNMQRDREGRTLVDALVAWRAQGEGDWPR
jgi:hypothetical protein